MQTLVLPASELGHLLTLSECIDLQERTFKAKSEGKAAFPTKCRLEIPDGSKLVYQAGWVGTEGALSSRVTSNFPQNPKHGLPRSMRVSILYDVKTGYPLAIMDGTYVMAMSRGGSSALSAKYLARKGSKRIGVIGSGLMARICAAAVPLVISAETIVVYSKTREHRENLARELREVTGCRTMAVSSAEKAARHSDIIITATSATKSLLAKEMVDPGTHIIAMGSKAEVHPEVMRGAKIVVDDRAQALDVGSVAKGVNQGTITQDDIYADLGEIIAGNKKGRTSDNEITYFDNSGLGIQDAPVALAIYNKARQLGIGVSHEILSPLESYPLVVRAM